MMPALQMMKMMPALPMSALVLIPSQNMSSTPDENASGLSPERAEHEAVRVNAANDVLSDAAKRAAYDRGIRSGSRAEQNWRQGAAMATRAAAERRAAEAMVYRHVRLHHLFTKPEYNGRCGVVVGVGTNNRLNVEMMMQPGKGQAGDKKDMEEEPTVLAFRKANLTLVTEQEAQEAEEAAEERLSRDRMSASIPWYTPFQLDGRKSYHAPDTCLYGACQRGSAERVAAMLQAGVSANSSREVDARGRTPLMLASANAHAAIVRLLLEAKAEVDARNSAGQTVHKIPAIHMSS